MRSVSLWTHLEFDKCDLENSVFDIFDIDSFAFFVCSICDSVYALYTCKHCSKVVQCLVKGACVCGWRLFMHLYALIQIQRGLSIIVISLLETFMFFFQCSYLFKSAFLIFSSCISYSYIPACADALYDVFSIVAVVPHSTLMGIHLGFHSHNLL